MHPYGGQQQPGYGQGPGPGGPQGPPPQGPPPGYGYPQQGPPQGMPPGMPPQGPPPGYGYPQQGMPPQGYGQDPMRLRPPMPAGGAGAFHQPKSSGGKKWAFLALGLLVLAGLVVGAIFLFSDGGSGGGGGQTTAPNIPVGPDGGSQTTPTTSLNAPPTSISIKPSS